MVIVLFIVLHSALAAWALNDLQSWFGALLAVLNIIMISMWVSQAVVELNKPTEEL